MEYRYRKISYRCSDCKFSFEKLRKFSVAKYPHGTSLPFPTKDPECPQCKLAKKVSFKTSVTDDTHAHINPDKANYVGGTPEAPVKAFSMGGSNFTKAMDHTAEIVMRDYGMTDLKDNLREGDSMAPKLRPDLEAKVDQVFKPQKPIAGQQAATAFNQTLKRQINAGAFRGYGGTSDVVARQQQSGIRVPTNVMFSHDDRGKPN